MKILYGVAGEGNGHATRSKVVIEHLRRRGHSVVVGASKQAYQFLHKRFPDVVEIQGYQIKYQDGAMDLPSTIALNMRAAPLNLAKNIAAARKIDWYRPDAVITDLEPFAYLYAKAHGLPVVSIDNHQAVPRCSHPQEIAQIEGLHVLNAFVSSLMPQCNHYIATSFFRPIVLPEFLTTTTIVPPVLRNTILQAKPIQSGHILVYQTDMGDSRLFDTLHSLFQQRFIVYGRDNTNNQIRHNCLVKTFNEEEFARDLIGANAVVSNGGYSLLSEAVAMGKPVFSVPVRHHAEQIFNSTYISQLNYGKSAMWFDSEALREFIYQTPYFLQRLRSCSQHDANTTLYATVDRLFG